jgi:hypothetical protein
MAKVTTMSKAKKPDLKKQKIKDAYAFLIRTKGKKITVTTSFIASLLASAGKGKSKKWNCVRTDPIEIKTVIIPENITSMGDVLFRIAPRNNEIVDKRFIFEVGIEFLEDRVKIRTNR